MPTKYKTPSQTDYAAAKARGASVKMNRALSLAAQAEKIAMSAIEEGARAVLKVGPLASEYVQGMGSWMFTVIIPLAEGGVFEENIGSHHNEIEVLSHYKNDFDLEYREHVEPLIVAIKEFRKLHYSYEDAFGNTAAGTPMRFGVAGKVKTEW